MGVVTPEGKVKRFIKKFMKIHAPDAWQYCPMGGPFGKAGAPDFLFLWRGVLIAIEAKAQNGVVTPLQRTTLEKLRAQGAVCAVVRGHDVEKLELIISVTREKQKERGLL